MTETPTPAARAPGAATAYTMYLDQSAHLDWDWIQTFEQNYWSYPPDDYPRDGVEAILGQAIGNLADPRFRYSICEMSFLRRHVEEHPEAVAAIRKAGDRFQALSGGITSPDCLVCSGEAFFRNYLVGQGWLKGALGLDAKPRCWIPDDFGQGPELPVLLAALGFDWVTFWRIPGGDGGAQGLDFLENGVDFRWTASDGSAVNAHWLLGGGYAMGNNVTTNLESVLNLIQAYDSAHGSGPTYSGARTPFMFVPVANDFSLPVHDLPDIIAQWNASTDPRLGPGATGVTLAAGGFDQFAASVDSAGAPLREIPYNGTPYWTGYFASRPALKILHYQAVRGLVAAEIMGLLAQPPAGEAGGMLPKGYWEALAGAWDDFTPSTHHDYICGTATDMVYANDQLPRLRDSADRGRALTAAALNAIAGMNASTGSTGRALVANSLGFDRSGIVEVAAVESPFDTQQPTQRSHEGGTLFFAAAPSLGYAIADAPAQPTAEATATQQGELFVLGNEFLTAYVDAAGDLVRLTDVHSGIEMLAGTPGNAIAFYEDSGGLYQFGNEPNDQGWEMALDPGVKAGWTQPGLGTRILETGPLRARVRSVTSYAGKGRRGAWTQDFTREYALVAGERFLRMTTTGAAPYAYSVMTAFPLAGGTSAIHHGTGYHWTNKPPARLDPAPVFRATHDFLLAFGPGDALLGAVYHGGMPAWSVDATQPQAALIGCLYRNTPLNSFWGAGGSDPAVHTQSYALRVPTGLAGPETGMPLREALKFHTPLMAVPIPDQGKPVLQGTASLASVPDSSAILTVAKPGRDDPASLVLRLYQPTNAALAVTVKLPSKPASAQLATASERAVPGAAAPIPTAQGLELTMERAVATLIVPGLGLLAGTTPAGSATPPAPPPPARPSPAPAMRRGLLRRIADLIRGR